MGFATIAYPDEVPELLQLADRDFPAELVFLAAAKLYELGRLTAGQAARLAGLDRPAFLRRLDQAGVMAINLQGAEVDAEVRAAHELAE